MPDLDIDEAGCQDDADREPVDYDDEPRDKKPKRCPECGWDYDGHKPGCPEET